MIQASSFVREAEKRGFGMWTGVPCSYLKPLINYVIDAPGIRYVAAANEGDAVAIASGAALGGVRGVVMFQNSGLGNAVNPLTSLNYVFKIPALLIVTLRGEPGGAPDEPQHALMGPITTAMLDIMKVRWEYFPVEESGVAEALDRAVAYMDETRLPFSFVMRKDSVAPWKLKSEMEVRLPAGKASVKKNIAVPLAKRGEMLEAVRSAVCDEDIIFATTGFTGRELYACEDADNQLYMAGSMGCVVSMALGLALVRPERRVVALDGDGAVLMRMGALSVAGYERPKNLVHIVFDNGHYESTGNQSTVSASVDMSAIAAACGYENALDTCVPAELAGMLKQYAGKGLTFIRAGIQPGISGDLPRPKISPLEVALRLEKYLKNRKKQ
jgi:phosphonopyruvate decarboxylase